MKQFKLSIPEPCQVPWDQMTSVDDTRKHCSSCEKIVIDFHQMTDAELISFFSKPRENVCGRLGQDQLDRSLPVLPEAKLSSHWWKAAMLIPIAFFADACKSISGIKKSETKKFTVQTSPNDTVLVEEQETVSEWNLPEWKRPPEKESYMIVLPDTLIKNPNEFILSPSDHIIVNAGPIALDWVWYGVIEIVDPFRIPDPFILEQTITGPPLITGGNVVYEEPNFFTSILGLVHFWNRFRPDDIGKTGSQIPSSPARKPRRFWFRRRRKS
jgi:hypothetical protein